MSREIESISAALFDKIRTRFDDVNLGDERAKATTDPEKARYFNFDYVDKSSQSHGNITVSLIDENSLKIYFDKDIKADMDDDQKDNWFDFLRNIRKFAKRNMMNFDVRDITKSNLDLKDIQQQTKSDSVTDVNDVKVTESRLWGTTRSSYQECGPVRIIVRHSDNVDETKRGARSRKIESVFLETELGERRLLPHKNLTYARAMAQHCSQGGALEDEIGESITAMCEEMTNMTHFCRQARQREFEDRETADMAQAAVHRYAELKQKLHSISGRRGYQDYAECYMPESDVEEEIDVDGLRERFVKKIYDDRFTEALPYVYRAYQRQQQEMESTMGEEFENWANSMTEMNLEEDLGDHKEEIEQLDGLMEKPIEVGPNGMSAIGALQDVIGDTRLDDKLRALADDQGDVADARQLVIDWLQDHGHADLATRYSQAYTQQMTPATDPNAPPPAPAGVQAPDPSGATYGGVGTAEPSPQANTAQMAEDTDPLSLLRSLAGLRKR
jgi:hypothetical protein